MAIAASVHALGDVSDEVFPHALPSARARGDARSGMSGAWNPWRSIRQDFFLRSRRGIAGRYFRKEVALGNFSRAAYGGLRPSDGPALNEGVQTYSGPTLVLKCLKFSEQRHYKKYI